MFCNSSLAELPEQEGLKTDYVQCNAYGETGYCPDSDLSYAGTGVISGSVYQGDIFLENSRMSDVYYAILGPMDEGTKEIFCASEEVMQGIIGIAYTALNKGIKLPVNGSVALSDVDVEICKKIDGTSGRNCNSDGLVQPDLPSPIEASLKLNVESGYDHADAFGLYVDYEATRGAIEDELASGLGALFGGDMAFNNSYYKGGRPQVSCIMVP